MLARNPDKKAMCSFGILHIFSSLFIENQDQKKELICFLFFSKNWDKSENKQKAKNCQLSNKMDSKYPFGCSLFFTEINEEKKLNEK